MAAINKITISGFRGILSPLILNFKKGSTSRSMVIYGRNGTGKSSITDAWEWFTTEKIVHLAREGAGHSSYPHKNAKRDETFIEIEFSDVDLGVIRLQYDYSRITMPTVNGNIDRFRSLVPHPCHIRFEDLTRFVYLRKTERFDALSQLMGFNSQVELQKSMSRVLREITEKLDIRKGKMFDLLTSLKEEIEEEQVDTTNVLRAINKILLRNGIKQADSINDLTLKKCELEKQVINDPRAKELNALRQLENKIAKVNYQDSLINEITKYTQLCKTFLQREQETADLILLELYEKGDEVLNQLKEAGEEINICPLCGENYYGDLKAYILEKIQKLHELKTLRDNLNHQREKVNLSLPKEDDFIDLLKGVDEDSKKVYSNYHIDSFLEKSNVLGNSFAKLRIIFSKKPENLESNNLIEINTLSSVIRTEREELSDLKKELNLSIESRINYLEKDESRVKLVNDHTKIVKIVQMWEDYKISRQNHQKLSHVKEKFEYIVEDYRENNIKNVQIRFDAISNDIQNYFKILEKDTEGLGKPELKLREDEDRAVELQIIFHGEMIYPAYRYLSESQLNSFGLAVFLASTKYFNKNFQFILLDDVINSLDGYKRPRVIELIKNEFPDHQVLLLTHDSVWSDRLFESLPSIIKCRFPRFELNHGPIFTDAYTPLENIEKKLDDDKPVEAGRDMGPFLERHLQEICESFQVLVKYNQKNEYSLEPLLDRFRIRVKEKLTLNHALYTAIKALQTETGFRNLCAHWKNPDIDITTPEMKTVVEKWKEIEKFVKCPICCCWLVYDGKSDFICTSCNNVRLTKPS